MPTSPRMILPCSSPCASSARENGNRQLPRELSLNQSRAQVDLIDMQSMCQDQHKIMVYQNHLTKFCILRPLTSKRAPEIAYQLLDIYLLLGAPSILQSDNRSEFTAQVITELKWMWPRHPQSQGSVERANCDIKDIDCMDERQ